MRRIARLTSPSASASTKPTMRSITIEVTTSVPLKPRFVTITARIASAPTVVGSARPHTIDVQ